MAAFTAGLPLAHPPGTVFNYSSGTTNLLSRIVADIVGYGDAYRTYLDQRLFGPLGMTSADPTFDDRGVFVASSYLHATALDFAKFGLLYLRGGEWDGRQIVSRAWAETAQVPLSVEKETGAYYSWQWWVTGDEYGTYWASGYEGQHDQRRADTRRADLALRSHVRGACTSAVRMARSRAQSVLASA